jgi:uncharacterized membrane protein YgdD (TMEM256/DUF423 family)
MRLDSARVLAASGVLLALAALLGALGTHALRGQLSAEHLGAFLTANRYQYFHSLGLLGVGLAMRDNRSPLLRWVVWLLVTGILIFCGTIYAVALGAPALLGALTALGGVLLMAAWIFFAWTLWQARVR